jgi:hypothetical protein
MWNEDDGDFFIEGDQQHEVDSYDEVDEYKWNQVNYMKIFTVCVARTVYSAENTL